MTVLYYTSTHFLDFSLEIINVLKKQVKLHVFIEISDGSKNFNIVDMEELPQNEVLIDAPKLLGPKSYEAFKPYFDGVEDVKFVIHPKKSLVSSFNVSYQALCYVKKIKPDRIHIESLAVRTISLIPSFFFTKRLLLSVHDPVRHSGEKDWKQTLTRFLLFNFPIDKAYFFYSKFAKSQFESYYEKIKNKKYLIEMSSYSFYKTYQKENDARTGYILFFGRLSPYKGIDTLLNAMPAIIEKFPEEKLIIAGSSFKDYRLNEEILNDYKKNIVVINNYITNEDLVALIKNAKFVVCPYTDATQSGVLMTSFALDKPVIATNVGAFPEYIEEGITGIIFPVNDHFKLAEKIIEILQNGSYKSMGNEIAARNRADLWSINKPVFIEAYS